MKKRRLISIIETEDFTYFNLHAEEVFSSNYLEDTKSGIDVSLLRLSTFERIIHYAKNATNIKLIVLDFKYITTCQPNFGDKIIELGEIIKIILLNISKGIVDNQAGIKAIQNQKNSNYLKTDNNETAFYECYYYFSEDLPEITNLEIKTKEIFENEFQTRLKKFIFKYEKFDEKAVHPSSSIYLNSYVDLKAMMASKKDKDFVFYALYCLALKAKKLIDDEKFKELDKVLVCQSLNGSYITSILSTLLKLDVLIFDKIGPVNKLYSRPNKFVNNEKAYIIVSDLVCLGTEVKIAKSILQFFGAKYLGHIALIKTETLKKEHIKKEDATVAVFSIKQDNSESLKYGIYTHLAPIKED